MSFDKVKIFWRKHKGKILGGVAVLGACAAGVGAGYSIAQRMQTNDVEEPEAPLLEETNDVTLDDIRGWKSEWDHDYDLVKSTAEELDNIDGKAMVIVGPGSTFRDLMSFLDLDYGDDNKTDIFLVDEDGCFFSKAEDGTITES